jgi:hypothetical protein
VVHVRREPSPRVPPQALVPAVVLESIVEQVRLLVPIVLQVTMLLVLSLALVWPV